MSELNGWQIGKQTYSSQVDCISAQSSSVQPASSVRASDEAHLTNIKEADTLGCVQSIQSSVTEYVVPRDTMTPDLFLTRASDKL